MNSRNFPLKVLYSNLALRWKIQFFNSTLFFYLNNFQDWKEKNEELNVWEDNWDDDNIEDDFSKQLK